MTEKLCPECNGVGIVDQGTEDESRCPTCNGSGVVPDDGQDSEEVWNAGWVHRVSRVLKTRGAARFPWCGHYRSADGILNAALAPACVRLHSATGWAALRSSLTIACLESAALQRRLAVCRRTCGLTSSKPASRATFRKALSQSFDKAAVPLDGEGLPGAPPGCVFSRVTASTGSATRGADVPA
jgi:hypothetical protein